MMVWDDKDFAAQMQNILLSDNPNYFDVESDQPKTPDTNSTGRRFFLFRRKSSSQKSLDKIKSKASPKKQDDQDPPPLEKRRSSFRGLLRSRSNSSSTVCSKVTTRASLGSADYANTPDYTNTGRFRERIGSYNESLSYLGSDDVFQTANVDIRTNIKMTPPPKSTSFDQSDGVRRHSVGNFSNKEKLLRTNLFTDEVPKTQAPRAPTLMGTRIRERRRLENLTVMDDILIVTAKQSEPGILWVNYLKTCFDKITKQRGRQPFNFLHLKIDNQQITPQLIQRCSVTKLQIVIICPSLLALKASYLMSQLSIILKPERVLGMLLDVTESRVMEIHREALPSYKQWRRCIVRNQDQSFVSDLLGIATDILGRALRQQPLCSEANTPTNKPLLHENFTLFPRKVKIGQNKVLAMFTEPLVKEDWIKVKIEKAGTVIEITNVKRRNPYSVQFVVPDACMEVSTMIGVRIERNNIDLGCRPVKCESRLRELEQLLRSQDNPMDFMCQSLGITLSDRDKLDEFFVTGLQKNMPPDFHLLNTNNECRTGKLRESYPEEYPTLLHFAARWGLENLCVQLMECPGGEIACEMRNIGYKTPAELAESAGFLKLASCFKNFSQMNEFSTMYHYFKGISDSSNNTAVIEAKPVGSQSPKSKPKTVDVETNDKESDQPEEMKSNGGYMEMIGSMSGSGSDVTDSVSHSQTDLQLFTATNLNYLSIYDEDAVLNQNLDTVDSITEKVKKDLKLDSIPVDNGVLSNEMTISEPSYYDSSEINNKTDEFSHECSMVLEECKSLTPSESNSEYLCQPSNVPVNVNYPKVGTLERAKAMLKSDPFADYLIQPSNVPVKDHKLANNGMSNYMNQPAIGGGQNRVEESSHLRLNFKKKDENFGINVSAKTATTPTESLGGDTKSRAGTLKRQGSNVSKKSVDDELLEIIYDFKNNVFTIQEVELLVATWKNRNDVQNGFRDKQEQLQKMREEYERIQQQMKEKLKRPTPFERMKRLFLRTKPQEKDATQATEAINEESGTLNSSKHRPISTVSLHSVSSSSSGRLSTGSACSGASLGDSGTHSDNDERKHGFCRISGASGHSMDNYLIPPTPRPVLTPTSTSSSFDDRFSRIRTNSASSEHYILFPSNMPVYPSVSKLPTSPSKNDQMTTSASSDYINLHTLNTIVETKEHNEPPHLQPVPIKIQKPEVIYSKFEKKTTSDICSTFRTPTSPIPIAGFEKFPHPQLISAKQEFSEQLKQLTKSLDCLNETSTDVEDSIKQLNQSIFECEQVQELNNNMNNSSLSSSLVHDYMNLKIN